MPASISMTSATSSQDLATQGQVTVGALEMIELRLLADPENAERQEAQHIGEHAGREVHERAKQGRVIGNAMRFGDMDLQHDERHGNGKEPVAQSCDALDAATRKGVIEFCHAAMWSTHAHLVKLRAQAAWMT